VNRYVNCFIEIDTDLPAVADKRAGGAWRSASHTRAPLAGVPFGYKDVFARDGAAPSVGARAVSLSMRTPNAPVLNRLERVSGALALGRLNMDEFAYSATGANATYGATANPWNPDVISGGSSSGAAAAVAAGAVPFAIGTDTGGSIRVPAALCGVVGLKPTFGLVPRAGAFPLSPAQDTVGVLARSALDVAAVLEHIAGTAADDPSSITAPRPPSAASISDRVGRSSPLANVRLGVDSRVGRQRPEVSAALDAAIDQFLDLGARVVEIDLSALVDYGVAATVLTWAEALALHGSALRRYPDRYSAATKERLRMALAVGGADHVNALRLQGAALRAFLDGPMVSADVVLTPTTEAVPLDRGALLRADGAEAVDASERLIALTRPLSFIGVPAASLPAGFDDNDLPVGIQLVCRPWAEDTLLTCAAAFQSRTSWHERWPPLPTSGGAMETSLA
jgi:aspartyl-tRNA(Asn)/glutamyl-tRNA(Gln) amidotransferase subunit A